ncbi:Class V chitinase, partial [Linum perenne]
SDFPSFEIDSAIFTHLFCAFADLDPQIGHAVFRPSNLESFPTFSATVRRWNPSRKSMERGGVNSNEEAGGWIWKEKDGFSGEEGGGSIGEEEWL